MEIIDALPQKKKKSKKSIEKSNVGLAKESIQYNSQDLDQEQNVNMNPVQLNTQNLRIIVGNDKNNYSGKITGTTYLEKSKEIAVNVDISLFFGHECILPVYKSKSDNNGNFIIEDLPPGYYTILADREGKLKYQSHYIKVFAGYTTHQSILLKR